MDTALDENPSVRDAATAQPESSDPAYLAWRDAKVKRALDLSRAHPERRIPQSEIWKRFGLES